jgi:hypothetical protein
LVVCLYRKGCFYCSFTNFRKCQASRWQQRRLRLLQQGGGCCREALLLQVHCGAPVFNADKTELQTSINDLPLSVIFTSTLAAIRGVSALTTRAFHKTPFMMHHVPN